MTDLLTPENAGDYATNSKLKGLDGPQQRKYHVYLHTIDNNGGIPDPKNAKVWTGKISHLVQNLTITTKTTPPYETLSMTVLGVGEAATLPVFQHGAKGLRGVLTYEHPDGIPGNKRHGYTKSFAGNTGGTETFVDDFAFVNVFPMDVQGILSGVDNCWVSVYCDIDHHDSAESNDNDIGRIFSGKIQTSTITWATGPSTVSQSGDCQIQAVGWFDHACNANLKVIPDYVFKAGDKHKNFVFKGTSFSLVDWVGLCKEVTTIASSGGNPPYDDIGKAFNRFTHALFSNMYWPPVVFNIFLIRPKDFADPNKGYVRRKSTRNPVVEAVNFRDLVEDEAEKVSYLGGYRSRSELHTEDIEADDERGLPFLESISKQIGIIFNEETSIKFSPKRKGNLVPHAYKRAEKSPDYKADIYAAPVPGIHIGVIANAYAWGGTIGGLLLRTFVPDRTMVELFPRIGKQGQPVLVYRMRPMRLKKSVGDGADTYETQTAYDSSGKNTQAHIAPFTPRRLVITSSRTKVGKLPGADTINRYFYGGALWSSLPVCYVSSHDLFDKITTKSLNRAVNIVTATIHHATDQNTFMFQPAGLPLTAPFDMALNGARSYRVTWPFLPPTDKIKSTRPRNILKQYIRNTNSYSGWIRAVAFEAAQINMGMHTLDTGSVSMPFRHTAAVGERLLVDSIVKYDQFRTSAPTRAYYTAYTTSIKHTMAADPATGVVTADTEVGFDYGTANQLLTSDKNSNSVGDEVGRRVGRFNAWEHHMYIKLIKGLK